MGLDMYLKRGKKIPTRTAREIYELEYEMGIINTEEVGYWRKANQINKWIFDNCHTNEDNDFSCLVTKEKLEELLNVCEKVLKSAKLDKGLIKNGRQYVDGKGWEDIIEEGYTIVDNAICKELLPTEDGFFFGSTEYDEFYLEDIENTIQILETVLKETDFEQQYIMYYASW